MELTQEHFDEIVKGLATKKDLEGLATKIQLDQAISGLATKDDLVSEIRPIKAQLASMETKIDRISARTNEDAVATIKDVEKLTGRLKKLETDVKQLKMQHAA